MFGHILVPFFGYFVDLEGINDLYINQSATRFYYRYKPGY